MKVIFQKTSLLLVFVCGVMWLSVMTNAQNTNKKLYRSIETVAGVLNYRGNQDTNSTGISTFYNPTAICLHYAKNDSLLISDSVYFRKYNMTDRKLTTEKNINWTDSIPQPSTCVNVINNVNKENRAYFASKGPKVIFMNNTNTTVINIGISPGEQIHGLTYYDKTLYAISNGLVLHECTIAENGAFTNDSCRITKLSAQQPSFDSVKIEVTPKYIFITTQKSLNRYRNNQNHPLIDSKNGSFYGIRRIQNNHSQLVVSDSDTLYYLDSETMSLTNITTDTDCKTSSKPCISSVNARTEDDIYFTEPNLELLRHVYLPDNKSDIDIPFPPFPINMTGANDTMQELYTEVKTDIFDKLNNRVSITQNQTYVDDTTWKTHMEVLIPQRVFDADETPQQLNTTNYTSALEQVRVYYNKTNQYKYMDLNILPFCNYTEMWHLQRFVALWARRQLRYDIIYSNPIEMKFNSSAPNLTRVKLLLPEGFAPVSNESANTTTPALLSFGDFDGDFITELYNMSGERAFHLVFPGAIFYFDRLNPNQVIALRWEVQQAVRDRLAFCARESGDASGGGINTSNTNGLVPGCTSFIGITNMTRLLLPGVIEPDFTYDVFIPPNYNYTFNITQCLDTADWSDILAWLDAIFAIPAPRKACGTGCIVGIAVACAVIATMLAILLIVLVSKRRRLAVVLAPPAQMTYLNQPKFVSSFNMEEDEEEEIVGSRGNPLVPKNK